MSPLTEPDVKISLIRLFRRTSPSLFRIGCEYSFVTTLNPHLSTEDVSLSQRFNCQPLPSTGITLLRRYYKLIPVDKKLHHRLPVRAIPSIRNDPIAERADGNVCAVCSQDNVEQSESPVRIDCQDKTL